MRALGVCNRPTPPQSLAVVSGLREREGRASEDEGKTAVVSESDAPPSVRAFRSRRPVVVPAKSGSPLRSRRPAAVPPSSGRPEGVHASDAPPGAGCEALTRDSVAESGFIGAGGFVGAAPPPRSISARSPIGPRVGASLLANGCGSAAGPCVARKVISACDKCSGNPSSRGGAQIHAPGAGSSCASRFHAATPKRCTLPSGCATHAQSARNELAGPQTCTCLL